jgi:hypothetical protein
VIKGLKMNNLNKDFGQAVVINGSPNKIRIIIAKRKKNFGTMFGYDYIAMNDFAFWMTDTHLREDMIAESVELSEVKMPDKYEDYNTAIQLEKAYESLKESFTNMGKSNEFEFISKDEFIKTVKSIVLNTFKAVA